MAHNFDDNAGFGVERPSSGFRALRNPGIVLSHVGFRAAALFFYFFANFFSSSFIIQFLVILTLLSMDFWTVKNITGRLLVGLRWWNLVDAEGKNHWKFESAKDQSRFDASERYIFWMGLVIAPAVWILFVITAFLTFKWEWMVIAILGTGMSSANFYGYLRCKYNSTTEITNYFSKLLFFSFLRRQTASAQSQNETI
ncbi:Golgi apparatus membrane protein TVP23-like protein [Aphelenchoides bicaudatus]|nr:Golgi apparatus membrane protein TVP23-like protein [Aphelenchoides bicaudatus]